MDSGQPPPPPGKIKANSSTENYGQLLEWIKANPPQDSDLAGVQEFN